MDLVTTAQMREMDRRTIEDVGLPGAVLMERAALGACRALLERWELDPGDRVGLACGGGNNGGDGLAMARILHGQNLQVVLALLADPSSLRGDAALNWRALQTIAQASGGFTIVRLHAHDDDEALRRALEALPPCAVWCDALLGTGLDREVTGSMAGAIRFLNGQPAVLAVDVPSGMEADTGRPRGTCVRADLCVALGLPKLGQALDPGRGLRGELVVVDIGIPQAVVEGVGVEARWLLPEAGSWPCPLPPRTGSFHKGDAGKVLVLGGGEGKAGAAILTARGALVTGAGLVTVGTTPEVVPLVAPAVPELMSAAVLDAGNLRREALREQLEGADVVAVGPGLGTGPGAQALMEALWGGGDLEAPEALVLDADALNLMAARPDAAAQGGSFDEMRQRLSAGRRLVLTPHPGEMARLVDAEIAEVTAAPLLWARRLAAAAGAVVVLKMGATVVVAPDGRAAINGTGNPGMASGGMGDALTGIVAATLCVVDDPFEASCLAVFAHGTAGDLAAARTGRPGVSASAVLDEVSRALELIAKERT